MQVNYYPDEDALIITAKWGGFSGATLRDDFGVILTFMDEGSEIITRVDILHASDYLPLDAERGYDIATDTLTLGEKPASDYRVVESGDFARYQQWFDDGSEWDDVAVDFRHASKHLAKAKVIAGSGGG